MEVIVFAGNCTGEEIKEALIGSRELDVLRDFLDCSYQEEQKELKNILAKFDVVNVKGNVLDSRNINSSELGELVMQKLNCGFIKAIKIIDSFEKFRFIERKKRIYLGGTWYHLCVD